MPKGRKVTDIRQLKAIFAKLKKEGTFFKPKKSQVIVSAGYQPKEKKLYVQFKSGSVYSYEKVPPKVFEKFKKARSAGRAFHKLIRDKFKYMRLR
jgi:hypothetical protein